MTAAILTLALTAGLAFHRDAGVELKSLRVVAPTGIQADELLLLDPAGRTWRPGPNGLLRVPAHLHGRHLVPQNEVDRQTFSPVLVDLGDGSPLASLRVR